MNKKADRGLPLYAPHALMLVLALLLAAAGFAPPRAGAAEAPVQEIQPVILILPFQVNADPSLESLEQEFPRMLAQSLMAKGIDIVPLDAGYDLIASRNLTALDLATVRSLGAALNATHAVYGQINQVGDAISVDSRLVTIKGTDVRPLFTDKGMRGNVFPAAEDLSTRISSQFVRRGAVAGIEVRGTKILDSEVVLNRINTRVGDAIDFAAIDREVKNIWDLGYFSDVHVDVEEGPEGYILVYTVAEKPRIETITVEGTKELDEEDILAAISTRSGSILNEKLLSQDILKILELYRQKGFYLATVDQRVDARQGGASAALVLTINEGNRLYIRSVQVEGVNQLSESDVKDQLLLKERGIISWITGTGVLKEELIERDSAAIASYYLDNGFLDVTVGAPNIEYLEEGITITFPIDEGPRYRLGEVNFAGTLIDTDERLRSVIKIDDMAQKNDYFNLSVMQEDTRNLTDFYADYGYAFASINANPNKQAGEERVVDIIFQIDKKNKVYVNRVLVEGNSKTRDNVILREMRLTDGDPFDGSKLRRSTERLNKLGYFEVAEAELVPTDNEEEVDLKIKVKERPTGAIMGGVGYSTFSSFGVSGTIMERNLWGKGYLVSAQVGLSGRRNAYQVSFTNPRWNDTDLSVGADLYHWRDDYWDYRKNTTGGVIRFAYPLGEYTALGWGYRLDRYKIYDLDDDVSDLIRRYATGDRWTSTLIGRITRDSTNRERPTSGNIDRFSVEYGGGLMQGDDDFITTTFEHQTYYELRQDHVLHFRFKAAAIFNNGSSEVPVFERFWMGGIDSVRGYRSRDLVPRDPKTDDRIGGTRMAFANFEYIWSISNEVGVNLVPFFDIGFNYADDQDYNFSDEIKKSVGLELRWRSPMGDLRFCYGFPLDEDRHGERGGGRFEFSMGQFF